MENGFLTAKTRLLQLCYVEQENPADEIEGLAAPTGVENPPYAFDCICIGTLFSPHQFASTI